MNRLRDNRPTTNKLRSERTTRRIGLARALSKLGYCSRSQAGEIIRAGRVGLNGDVQRNPETPVNLAADSVMVDGKVVCQPTFMYFVFNKPRGLVTTASHEKGRTTIYDRLPHGLPWLSPVGRLDKASEGLLLLTNDTEWAARITAPESRLDKTYHVQIDKPADGPLIERITAGVTAAGQLLRAKRAMIVRVGQRNSWIEIVLDEGRNRHIRRMLGQLGIDVLRLVRIAIGPIELGALPKGSCRQLSTLEKQKTDAELDRK